MEWVPVAQAVTALMFGPLAPSEMEFGLTHVGNHHRNEEWAYPFWAFFQQCIMLFLPCTQSTNT